MRVSDMSVLFQMDFSWNESIPCDYSSRRGMC